MKYRNNKLKQNKMIQILRNLDNGAAGQNEIIFVVVCIAIIALSSILFTKFNNTTR